MDIIVSKDLNSTTYADGLAIRQRVFIAEQGVDPDLEIDQDEAKAIYFVAYSAGLPAGVARLLPAPYGYHVQRVAVEKAFRHHGIGKALMEAIHDFAAAHDAHELRLNAQVQAVGFYTFLGYTPTATPEFLDAGIPHREMHLVLADTH